MTQPGTLHIDTVIFGGGAAGLWLLDELTRRNRPALLLEAHDLGSGQTVASQGIIHGGLKYTLSGMLTGSAQSIRDMPLLWRRALAGEITPNLSKTRLRAEFCHLWRTKTISSKLAMIGARAGLRIAPKKLDTEERPPALATCPGTVARLDEQVVDPASFIADLASQHARRLLQIDVRHGLEFVTDRDHTVQTIRLINPETGEPLDVLPRTVVFLAGSGNASLREAVGLQSSAMQRRPLHMVLARGELPTLNGHCVDGSSTRLTITTARDFADRTIWQIGGQIAERGTELDTPELIQHAKAELADVLPGVDFNGVEWATYRVDRAEAAAGGRRPEHVSLMQEGNVITGWPTKLALVPALVEAVVTVLPECQEAPSISPDHPLADRRWPRPVVAAPPWENAQWFPGN